MGEAEWTVVAESLVFNDVPDGTALPDDEECVQRCRVLLLALSAHRWGVCDASGVMLRVFESWLETQRASRGVR